MRYLSVAEMAKKWNVSERSVRNYCAQGRVLGAFLTGKAWNIPEEALKPERSNKKQEEFITLLAILREEMDGKHSGSSAQGKDHRRDRADRTLLVCPGSVSSG